MKRTRVIIMGAAGRDFHNFNVCFRNNPAYRVVAFTAAQIPYITNRRYPASLAGRLYPRGIPVYDEEKLTDLIRKQRIEQVFFAYSDLSHHEVMHKASLVLALGAEFRFLGPDSTMLKSRKPVISVCAVRTGAGKSQVTRYISGIIAQSPCKAVVVRHPMPYGNLERQVVERFACVEDMAIHECTIEEREEFEPLLREGAIVYAGVDYEKVLRAAEKEGDIIVWDGGNNDFPFFRPDLEITIVDPLRPGHETEYFPGEVNLRRAHVVIINKVDAADAAVISRMEDTIRSHNPDSIIIQTASAISVDDPGMIAGKKVLVVEDGPTITHGGMSSGAGFAAAGKFSAAQVVDPRPYAVDSIIEVYGKYPHIGPVLPAMGYSPGQIHDLRKTIERCPCDLVLSATPIDLKSLITIEKPVVRVSYEIREREGEPLKEIINGFIAGYSRSTVPE
ncbi:MAG TPA: cyclic 2,3-diphosphoglycerate synthase [Geobacteraceae bacterium]|nr:cyclic 2,3-diphosphoglycerate synthase [Geobacteraceae bacterium]